MCERERERVLCVRERVCCAHAGGERERVCVYIIYKRESVCVFAYTCVPWGSET